MPKVGDKVRYHFIHTHVAREGADGGFDPVWRVRDAVVAGVHEDPPSVDLDVAFQSEDFEDGSSPAPRQTYVMEAKGEPQTGEYTLAETLRSAAKKRGKS